MTKPSEAPVMEGIVTASEVASELGISRTTANKMITRGDFESLRLLGKRPVYVVDVAELELLKAKRSATTAVEE